METFSALLAICAGNSPVTGEFAAQRPVTRSFDVFFDLRPNKRLSKQLWSWWFETPSCPLWRHSNGLNDGSTTSDKSAIANKFNEFLIDVGPRLTKCIPKVDTEPKCTLWSLDIYIKLVRIYVYVLKWFQKCTVSHTLWVMNKLGMYYNIKYMCTCSIQINDTTSLK